MLSGDQKVKDIRFRSICSYFCFRSILLTSIGFVQSGLDSSVFHGVDA